MLGTVGWRASLMFVRRIYQVRRHSCTLPLAWIAACVISLQGQDCGMRNIKQRARDSSAMHIDNLMISSGELHKCVSGATASITLAPTSQRWPLESKRGAAAVLGRLGLCSADVCIQTLRSVRTAAVVRGAFIVSC